MRVIQKICPACKTTFEAKRKNQVYCSGDCREDANNDKLKAKYHNVKTLEKDKEVGEQYKAKFVDAIRIVLVEYNEGDINEVITFEGKKFKKELISSKYMQRLGLTFIEDRITEKGLRVAVYIPQENAICLLPRYSSFSSNEEVTYRLIKKKKVVST